MERKLKLAKLILLEAEGLKDATSADSTQHMVTLAEELTKDAIALAKLIHDESGEKEVA